jgi:hypothetical protein
VTDRDLDRAHRTLIEFAAVIMEQDHENVPPQDQAGTIAHLCQTVRNELGHVQEHAGAAQDAEDEDSRQFNVNHAVHHTGKAIEHMDKLITAIGQRDPEVNSELKSIKQATGALV